MTAPYTLVLVNTPTYSLLNLTYYSDVSCSPDSVELTVVAETTTNSLTCVNATKDYVGGKALVVGRVAADPARLADAEVPLKTLAAAFEPKQRPA